jgi:23S rRNA (cytidine1920-2'-O)/16S rRNA (cytidine1409-2'-O)-methyltransferase
MTPEALREACEEALCERIEAEPEDNDTQPVAPYAWMRNGGVVDEAYDDSDDAKEHDVEAFKAERAAKAQARAAGHVATVRQRRAGREDVAIPAAFDLVTGDLSFISLTLVLPALVPLLAPQGQLLLLAKPQFELQPGQVGKGGIVRDAALFPVVEQRLRDCCAQLGLQVLGWHGSAIEGGDGNREFFIHARRSA